MSDEMEVSEERNVLKCCSTVTQLRGKKTQTPTETEVSRDFGARATKGARAIKDSDANRDRLV